VSTANPIAIEEAPERVLPMPQWELVIMVASLMALNALAIDIMLPALSNISEHYSLIRDNDQQLVIFAYIAGFGAPQLVFGPISDRFGRKGLLAICLIGYAIAGLACIMTTSFMTLLIMRFIQGIFASGVRVIAVSIVRDLLSGREMARLMSLVMTVFMVVPILAPTIGAGVMLVAPWQWTFGLLSFAAMVNLVWIQLRLPETLGPEHRQPLNLKQTGKAYWQVVSTRITLGYMCASGVIFGALFAFVAASEQIFTDVFQQHDTFVLWFAGVAAALAAANFTNSRIVEKYGMRRISHTVLILFIILALINVITLYTVGEKLWLFYPLFCLSFGCFGMLGANFTALAMEPQGKIAGTASAAYGFASTTFASAIGYLVAGQFDGTVIPFMWGFVGLGAASLTIVFIAERGKLFQTR
jgi:DHA1 family bicyclomycin/chloramphenicol resistance-like MFS transporter